MCFDYDETYDVFSETWHRARKPHHCVGCGKDVKPGDLYVAGFGTSRNQRRPDRWSECEACRYHRALIYACERAEGCREFESWYPLETLHEDMRERGWGVPGLVESPYWEDDDGEYAGSVVRFPLHSQVHTTGNEAVSLEKKA